MADFPGFKVREYRIFEFKLPMALKDFFDKTFSLPDFEVVDYHV
jgi:hypothetical protein